MAAGTHAHSHAREDRPPPPPPSSATTYTLTGAQEGRQARQPTNQHNPSQPPLAAPCLSPEALAVPRTLNATGDAPGPRCGHTLTTVAPAGPVVGAKLVLFGGATALEGGANANGAGGSSPGTPTTSGPASTGAGIRLAGATNDVHVFDVGTGALYMLGGDGALSERICTEALTRLDDTQTHTNENIQKQNKLCTLTYSGTWRLLRPEGEPPSARAAHAAASVGTMVVVHGGIGPAGLSGDDLHVLDVSNWDHPRWHRVVVPGQGPGARYAHCASLVAQRFLLVLGGNDGQRALGDVWALDTSQKPYRWMRVDHGPRPPPSGSGLGDDSAPTPVEPSARMYASTASRSDGLLLLCGGRDGNGKALGEAYGLARHRDGRWEWAHAPGAPPGPARYQHGCAFVGAKLHLVGGALGGGRVVDAAHAIASLDTAQGTWSSGDDDGAENGSTSASGATPAAASTGPRRCRHAVASAGSFVFAYGGLVSSTLLSDMIVLSDADGIPAATSLTETSVVRLLRPDASVIFANLGVNLASHAWAEWIAAAAVESVAPAAASSAEPPPNLQRLVAQSAEEAAVATRALNAAARDASAATAKMEADAASAQESDAVPARPSPGLHPIRSMSFGSVLQAQRAAEQRTRGGALMGSAPGLESAMGGQADAVRLYHRAVVVAAESDGELGGLVRQLSIDQFENESRRMSRGEPADSSISRGGISETPVGVSDSDSISSAASGAGSPAERGSPPSLFPPNANHGASPQTPALPLLRQPSVRMVHRVVLNTLLRPRELKEYAPMDRRFLLSADEFIELCEQVENIFREEPTVLEVGAPVKIFGDLHGQFGDLMRLFDEYGAPSLSGDITYIDYLFLGDYVDRGMYSLETIALLFALKIEYPQNIHMIRGNHEAKDINALFGFRMECIERFGASQGLSRGSSGGQLFEGGRDALEADEPLGAWGEDLYGSGSDDHGDMPYQGEGIRAWTRVNEVFDWMPLCANIEGKILCMHGGIGRWIESVEQIKSIKRPVGMEDGGQLLMDLLWSDPTSSDDIHGVQPSPRGPGLVTFGPDRVADFCEANNLQMIVRAHECVMDGFERFAGGKLITLFSATNYCGSANNAGAILVLGRDLVMVPKLIHPLPPQPKEDVMDMPAPRTADDPPTPLSGSPRNSSPFAPRVQGEGLPGLHPATGAIGTGAMLAPADTWMSRVNEERPPTPPRGRSNGNQGLAYI